MLLLCYSFAPHLRSPTDRIVEAAAQEVEVRRQSLSKITDAHSFDGKAGRNAVSVLTLMMRSL